MSLAHSFGLLFKPDREWKAIRKDSESTLRLYFGHVLILALIPALAGFIGTTQVGWKIGDGQVTRLSVQSGLSLSILFYAAMLAGIFILGKFIDFFSATYGVSEHSPRGVTMAAYTATPIFLIGVIAVYPNIWVNMLAGLVAIAYAVFLLYEGLPILMKIPEDRGFMFATAVLTVGLVMFVALLAISVVIWSVGVGPVYIA
ncbi:YIP1 family protein [Marinobacter adhaerens]|uniref:YIP1 family protein n=1 Tax=Marinobacter adhaerens TaxID=1033846 RepID=A0A851HU11_9GAMM|nr:Yip1 family protein [Marinobacter adhaerens]NWN92527.1 YIP1 family protein [Marinobacter adhaerens]